MNFLGKEEQPGKNNASEGVPIKKRRFPVFSNDEQFGNNADGAGVPIKKRGFPFLRPPSPICQESNVVTCQESSCMDATVVSKSFGQFDCSKNSLTEGKQEIATPGSNVDISNPACQPDVGKLESFDTACPSSNERSEDKEDCNTESSKKRSEDNEDCNTEKIVKNHDIASANRSNWDLNTTMDAWGGFCDDTNQLDMVTSNESNEVGSCLEVGAKVDLDEQSLGDDDARIEAPDSTLPSTQYRAEDMVHQSLSLTFALPNCCTEPNTSLRSSATMPIASPANLASCSSALVGSDLVMVIDSKLLGEKVSTKNSTGSINVKPESPAEGIAKNDSVAAKVNSVCYKHDLLTAPSGSSSCMNSGLSTVNCVKVPLQDSVAAKVNSEASLTIEKKEVVEKSGIAITSNVVGLIKPGLVEPELTSVLTGSTVKNTVEAVLQSQEIMNSCSSLLPSSSDVLNQEQSGDIPLQGRNNFNTCGPEDSNTFGSDDEKLDIDMSEEDSYGSESDSESHATKRTRSGKEEEDFEDGEIRESLLQNTTAVVVTDNGDCENNILRSFVGLTESVSLNQGQIKDKDHGCHVGEDQIKEFVDANLEERSDRKLDSAGPAVAEIVSTSNETKRRLEGTGELCDDGAKVTKTETKITVGDIQNDCKKGETKDSSLNARLDGSRDAVSGGGSGRSRIITLSRSSNVKSPSKTRYVQESLFERETRNERCTSFEEDKLQLQTNRGEMLRDGPRKFVRDRLQEDQSFRGEKTEISRGSSRACDRFDSSEWVSSGRKFKPDNYSGEYQLSRNKHASASNDELESSRFPLAQDDDIIASGISGRKPLNDESPSFRNVASRRSSPIVRGPTTGEEVQVIRRVVRNISRSEEESSYIRRNRHVEKYSRKVPLDISDPVYPRSQHANDGIDDQYYRKFSFVERRGIIPSRVRSKSPTRTRMRSPDGYNRIRELQRQQRSPPAHRMCRVRSPPLNFPVETVSRRRGSPPCMVRPLYDFQRPIMLNRRSPFERPMPSNNRQYDISLDSYDRPIRVSRFDEIDEEEIGGDRIRSSERRGGRGSHNESFRFRQEGGGPSPLKFPPKGDLEFTGRNTSNSDKTSREREFDRRIKSRPVIAPSRRIRAIEDNEGDFRQGGSVWHDESFADTGREKRRRFLT